MNTTEVNKIENRVSEVYSLINKMIGKSIELMSYVYPQHDGVQDTEAVGNLMYLRQSLSSLSKACKLLDSMLTDAIADTLVYKIINTGFCYTDNGDGTYNVCCNHKQDANFNSSMYNVATIKEDVDTWYVDNNCGLGYGEYPKKDWSLADAIKDQCENLN